jgi:hypothetical protein
MALKNQDNRKNIKDNIWSYLMSKSLSSVAKKEFDTEVKQAYQGTGMLRDCVTTRNNVVGDTYNFRKMGKGLANQKSTADLVTPMDVSHALIPAILQNWNAPEYTDIFDQQDVNFDERRELAQAIAKALGRRLDQIVIDAMDASTPTIPDITVATNLAVSTLIAASTALTDLGVPNDGRRAMAINAAGLEGLLKDETATSADYAALKALVKGDINSYVGFNIKIIETRAEGGLTVNTNIVDAWAFHQDSIGLAIGIDLKTSVDWVPERTSWLSNGMMKAGSAVRDLDGLVRVQYDQTA